MNRYARRQMKKAQKRQEKAAKPLEEMHFVIEQCIVPTLLIMKGHCDVGNLAMVAQGIENLLDSFSGFVYNGETGNANHSGDSHGNAVEHAASLPSIQSAEFIDPDYAATAVGSGATSDLP